jgi:hypothetical protein
MRHPLSFLAGLLLISATLAAPVRAQIVRGQVADSIMQVPIAGAVITLVDAGGADVARTVSDENGLFLLRATRAGDYRVRVEQSGYRPSTFPPFALAQDDVQDFMLLVASVAPQLVELSTSEIMGEVCPEGTVRPGQGVMIGFVRDDTGTPVRGAAVVGTWPAAADALLDLVEGGDRGTRRGEVTTDSNGVYVACGVPAETPLAFHAAADGLMSDFIGIRFDSAGVVVSGVVRPEEGRLLRHDFELELPSSRTVTVAGVVIDAETGEPLAGAAVTLEETHIQTITTSDGAFRLAGLPSGPLRFGVRHPGFQPLYREVSLQEQETRTLPSSILQMQALPTELTPVTVAANRSPTRRPLEDFWERREHSGGGSFITREEFANTGSPRKPTDVLRRMGGVLIRSRPPSQPIGLWVLMGRSMNPRSITGTTGPCFPLVFMDGHHLGNTDDIELDDLLNLTDVEAIEVHRGLAVPREFAWRGFECGVIVFWTR